MAHRYSAPDSFRDRSSFALLPLLALLLVASGCSGTREASVTERVPVRATYQPERFTDAPAPKRSAQATQATRIHTKLMDAYQAWAGTPYQWGGNGPNGFDCSGLIARVFKETFALPLPRTTYQMLETGEHVPQDALRVGDLVFFKPNPKGNHAGIYLGNGSFFHASSSRGVMQSHLDEPYWARAYTEARRVLPWSPEPHYADTHPTPRVEDRFAEDVAPAPPVASKKRAPLPQKTKSTRRGW